MKKILFLATLACVFAACDEFGKEVVNITDNPILSDEPTTPLQPSEQKVKLESVARNFMSECPAEDFEKISGIADAFVEKFGVEGYDLTQFENWIDSQYETAWKGDYEVTTSGGKVDVTESYDLLFLIANHKGHFDFGEKGVTVNTEYDGLKVTCSVNGNSYEAVIEQSGKVTNAIYTLTDNDLSTGNGYYTEDGEWIEVSSSTQVTNKWNMKLTVGVPERIDITVSENGSPLAQITAEFTPGFTASGIVPTKDSFSTETTIRIEDYEYVIENLKYDGAAGTASTSQTLKKNGKTLISYNVSGNVRIEVVTEKEEWDGYSYEYQYVKASLAKDITAALDILGEVQVIGFCSNAMEASDEMEAFWDALYSDGDVVNENAAQRHLGNFNAKFDFGVFYDKGNNRQADLEFEYRHNPGEEADWDVNGDGLVNGNDRYNGYYEFFPVIVFNDGSRYSVEEYFTEDAFGNLVEDFYEFCESFGEVFGVEDEVVELPGHPEEIIQ